jgi:Zn-dependent protease
MPLALETAVYSNPLFWAVFVGWVMSVVLHEFAHGLVAYWGGDYTIRERGGLTLNPLQYVDPINSLVLPLVFLLLGGIPLPGGVTFIRKDLLRNRAWDAASSLAGPAMNFLIFLACFLPMHPRIGWIDINATESSGPATVLATLGLLQFVAMLINLIPVPPLDGFQAVAAYMNQETRVRLLQPQVQNMAMLGLFVVLWFTPLVGHFFLWGMNFLTGIGFDTESRRSVYRAMGQVLLGS